MIKTQHINRIILISICACYLIFSTAGCSKRTNVPAPNSDTSDALESISGQLTAYVYIDSTVSMEGFVRPSSATNYIQTLQVIESAINTGWKTSQIHFFKFGTKILPLKNREHLKAVKKEFYQTPETKIKTYIEKVINEPKTCSNNSLTVIVTDLFQNDADVSLLTNVLNEKCLKKNFAIGILGIGSQYDGTVYDVGIQSYSFSYKSNDTDTKTFRPFYLLILGKHADVANYFEQLKSNLSFIKDTFVIFSRYIVNPLASFEGASMEEIRGLAEVTNIISTTSQDSRVKQFIIRKDSNVGFTATLKYNQLPYTIPFDTKKLTTEVIAKQFDFNDGFKENSDAKQSFNIEYLDSLKLKVNLTPTTLPGNGIYSYEIIISPSKNAYKGTYWWNDWDMDLSRIDKWRRNPKSFEGSKTLNLKPFMNNLWQANFLTHQPKIARIYCYFKK